MIAAFLLVLSCAKSTKAECSEDTPCAFGEECIEGQCVASTCATSTQCGIEQYCGADNTCVAGCQEDSDCMFGDYCDTDASTCVAAECTDTHLDCSLGEFCSPTGDCYEAGGYYCRDCEEDGDCGGGGNYCYSGYCGVECDSQKDCPAGYDCVGLQDLSGNIVTHICFTACWLFEDRQ